METKKGNLRILSPANDRNIPSWPCEKLLHDSILYESYSGPIQRDFTCHYSVQKGSSQMSPVLSNIHGNNFHLVQQEEDDDEITLEEATKFLEDQGLIKAKDIHYLPEDERENLTREVNEQPLTEIEQKKKIKEMAVQDASDIQTYYKSSRLGIREIEKQMTKEELAQERE